ncbi:MAG: hypothetical protein HY810_04610 [Candidatus Omnitrophica bacterium]|nr:hypothetical protein [Candidatus Omnitrophota bacterium]
METFLKPVIISLTFSAGFFLLEIIIKSIKGKRIYCFFIELAYFMVFWIFVYLNFI